MGRCSLIISLSNGCRQRLDCDTSESHEEGVGKGWFPLKVFRRAQGHTLPVHPLVFVSGSVALGLLFALQAWINYRQMNFRISLLLLLEAWGAQFLIWAMLCWLTWALLGDWLQRTKLFWLLCSVLTLAIIESVAEDIIWAPFFPQLPLNHNLTFWQRVAFELRSGDLIDGVVIFCCALALFGGVDYYLRFREQEQTAAHLKAELSQAQLRVLRMHLNPHFLFNTLNSISSLMRSDVASADIMLEQFSDLLRITLERGDVQLIPLCEEIEVVEIYMAIQNRRFVGRLHQEVRIDPALHDALIPAMILQPIVENAYSHGLSCLEGKGTLRIEARQRNKELIIEIANSGVGIDRMLKETKNREGMGLKNVTNRLNLHYREAYSLSLSEGEDGTVQVTMILPLQLSSSPIKQRPTYGA